MTWTDAQLLAIAGPKATLLTVDRARQLLSSDSRPRVYGIRNGENDIIALRSVADVDKWQPDHAWITRADLADFVRPAR